LRTAPKVIPRSRCLRSRMVKTMTGTRNSVAPAATAGQSCPPTPMIVGMKGKKRPEALKTVRELKEEFGIESHYLEEILH